MAHNQPEKVHGPDGQEELASAEEIVAASVRAEGTWAGARPAMGRRFEAGGCRETEEWLAEERPLEIAVEGVPLTVVLRTPSGDEDDVALAAGLLLAEGVIDLASDLAAIAPCESPLRPADGRVVARLAAGVPLPSGERLLVSATGCGMCGKTLASQLARRLPGRAEPARPPGVAGIRGADRAVAAAQRLFGLTGGVHAAATFRGEALVDATEDVGRHNAVDRLVGRRLLRSKVDLAGLWLWVSGRVSFELVQKALRARAEGLVAVGAPTALAVELAREHGLTLVGFARGERFTVYAGEVGA
jgi:FdhD protein